MNYTEARAFIDERPRYGGELGLDAIRALLEEVGHPERSLAFIHIAGTNGKGSVLSYISTVLTEAGYLVGRYISPTLYSYRERVQVNGTYIGREDYTRLVGVLKTAVERMAQKGIIKPSPFELETVLSFLYFKERRCDYVVLECGLGGLNDATNVIPMENKRLAVVTSVSMDHMEYLGDTLEKIALQKAGIIGHGVPVILAPQKPEVERVIEDCCRDRESVLVKTDLSRVEFVHADLEGQSFYYRGNLIEVRLAGAAQVENAAAAFDALQALCKQGIRITPEQISEGMKKTRWNGRFTKIADCPLTLVDGAHNPDAAAKLKASVEQYLPGRRLIFINGMFSDKDYVSVARITAPLAEQIFTIATPGNDRALPAEELAEVIGRYNPHVRPCGSIREAVMAAREAAGEEGVILTFGSLSFIGMLTEIVEEITEQSGGDHAC